MKVNKLLIKTKSKTYPIYLGNNILKHTGRLIKKKIPGVKKICIIADKKLPNKLLKNLVNSLSGYNLKIYKLSSTEKTKRVSGLQDLRTALKVDCTSPI